MKRFRGIVFVFLFLMVIVRIFTNRENINQGKLNQANVKPEFATAIADGIEDSDEDYEEKILSISKFKKSKYKLKIGNDVKLKTYITPNTVTEDDFEVINDNEDIVDISDIELTEDGERAKLTFTVKALSKGKAAVRIVSADGEKVSNIVSFTVKKASKASVYKNENTGTEKVVERTVYITPTGKRYHFSARCAGRNATPVTLSEAERRFTPCKKCAR